MVSGIVNMVHTKNAHGSEFRIIVTLEDIRE